MTRRNIHCNSLTVPECTILAVVGDLIMSLVFAQWCKFKSHQETYWAQKNEEMN